MTYFTHGQTVGPAGGDRSKAKVKPVIVIVIIKIDLNWSNWTFTYKE
jgi:hypothetical protein